MHNRQSKLYQTRMTKNEWKGDEEEYASNTGVYESNIYTQTHIYMSF